MGRVIWGREEHEVKSKKNSRCPWMLPNIPPPNTWCLDTLHVESSLSSSLLPSRLISIWDWLIWNILHLEWDFKGKHTSFPAKSFKLTNPMLNPPSILHTAFHCHHLSEPSLLPLVEITSKHGHDFHEIMHSTV